MGGTYPAVGEPGIHAAEHPTNEPPTRVIGNRQVCGKSTKRFPDPLQAIHSEPPHDVTRPQSNIHVVGLLHGV